MVALGYALAVLIGVSLGLVGSGGSILTIPILVYVMGISPSITTSYSLFVVGASASVGAGKAWRDGLLDFKVALSFGMPSIAAIFLVRRYVMPAVPAQLGELGGWVLTKDLAIMLLFAVLMVFASLSMIRSRQMVSLPTDGQDLGKLWLRGALVGVITGIVGVGGGFLIVPALVFMARLEMKRAVATSLIIVSVNSYIGFFSGLQGVAMDWLFLLSFSACAILGILLGMFLARYVSNERLKPAFGWFILLMGIYIITREIFFPTT